MQDKYNSKINSETSFSKNRTILKPVNWFAKRSIDWFLCDTSFYWKVFPNRQVQVFFKDMLIFRKQSNIDSLKIFYRLTLPSRLNSFKLKAFYWLECYVNCYAYFNRLLLLTNFLILTCNVGYLRLGIKISYFQ